MESNNESFVNTSGKGFKAPVPAEIKGWSWGASILTWIWGISHKVWISLIVFIPYIGWVMALILGYKGNEWAWQSQHYDSIAEFKERERKWTKASFLILGISIVIMIILAGFIFAKLQTLFSGLKALY